MAEKVSHVIDTGGPAFPEVMTDNRDEFGNDVTNVYSEGGMTLRDYFAAAALPAVYRQAMTIGCESQDHIVAEAYELADSMLDARKGSR